MPSHHRSKKRREELGERLGGGHDAVEWPCLGESERTKAARSAPGAGQSIDSFDGPCRLLGLRMGRRQTASPSSGPCCLGGSRSRQPKLRAGCFSCCLLPLRRALSLTQSIPHTRARTHTGCCPASEGRDGTGSEEVGTCKWDLALFGLGVGSWGMLGTKGCGVMMHALPCPLYVWALIKYNRARPCCRACRERQPWWCLQGPLGSALN